MDDRMVAVVRSLGKSELAVTILDSGKQYTLIPNSYLNNLGSTSPSKSESPRSPDRPRASAGTQQTLHQVSSFVQTSNPGPRRVDSGCQAVDARYATNYRLSHCRVSPTSPPESLSEFPVQRPHGGGNLAVSSSAPSGDCPCRSFAKRRSSESATQPPNHASSHFENSLRRYPPPEQREDILQKLIDYTQNKHESLRQQQAPARTRADAACETSRRSFGNLREKFTHTFGEEARSCRYDHWARPYSGTNRHCQESEQLTTRDKQGLYSKPTITTSPRVTSPTVYTRSAPMYTRKIKVEPASESYTILAAASDTLKRPYSVDDIHCPTYIVDRHSKSEDFIHTNDTKVYDEVLNLLKEVPIRDRNVDGPTENDLKTVALAKLFDKLKILSRRSNNTESESKFLYRVKKIMKSTSETAPKRQYRYGRKKQCDKLRTNNFYEAKDHMSRELNSICKRYRHKVDIHEIENLIIDIFELFLECMDENAKENIYMFIREKEQTDIKNMLKSNTDRKYSWATVDLVEPSTGKLKCFSETILVYHNELHDYSPKFHLYDSINSLLPPSVSRKERMKRYKIKLFRHIEYWLNTCTSLNTLLPRDLSLKKHLIMDLTQDIVDRNIFLQIDGQEIDAKSEEGYLKFIIFKWIKKHSGGKIIEAYKYAPRLMHELKRVPVVTSNEARNCIIYSFIANTSSVRFTPNSYSRNLANEIRNWVRQQKMNNPNFQQNMDNEKELEQNIVQLADYINNEVTNKPNKSKSTIDISVPPWVKKSFKFKVSYPHVQELQKTLKLVPIDANSSEQDKSVIINLKDLISEWWDTLPMNREAVKFHKDAKVHELATIIHEHMKEYDSLQEKRAINKIKQDIMDCQTTLPIVPNKKKEKLKYADDLTHKILSTDVYLTPEKRKSKENLIKELNMNWLRSQLWYKKSSVADKQAQESIMLELSEKLCAIDFQKNKDADKILMNEISEHVAQLRLKHPLRECSLINTATELKTKLKWEVFKTLSNEDVGPVEKAVHSWYLALPIESKCRKSCIGRMEKTRLLVDRLKELLSRNASDKEIGNDIKLFMTTLKFNDSCVGSDMYVEFLINDLKNVKTLSRTSDSDVPDVDVIQQAVTDWCSSLPITDSPVALSTRIKEVSLTIHSLLSEDPNESTDDILEIVIRNFIDHLTFSNEPNKPTMVDSLHKVVNDLSGLNESADICRIGSDSTMQNQTPMRYEQQSPLSPSPKMTSERNNKPQPLGHTYTDLPGSPSSTRHTSPPSNYIADDDRSRMSYPKSNTSQSQPMHSKNRYSGASYTQDDSHSNNFISSPEQRGKRYNTTNVVAPTHRTYAMGEERTNKHYTSDPTGNRPTYKKHSCTSNSHESTESHQSQNMYRSNKDPKVVSSHGSKSLPLTEKHLTNTHSSNAESSRTEMDRHRYQGSKSLPLSPKKNYMNRRRSNEHFSKPEPSTSANRPDERRNSIGSKTLPPNYKKYPMDQRRESEPINPQTAPLPSDKYPPVDATKIDPELQSFLDKWVQRIPLPETTAEDKELAPQARHFVKIAVEKRILEIRSVPQAVWDKFLAEDLLDERLNNVFKNLPQSQELTNNARLLKAQLLEEVIRSNQRMLLNPTYRFQLFSEIERMIPHKPPESKMTDKAKEVLRAFVADGIVDIFIQSKYEENDEEMKMVYKAKLYDEIKKIVTDIEIHHDGPPIDGDELKMRILDALHGVPLPTEADRLDAVKEAYIKEEVSRWYDELPLDPPTNENDAAVLKQFKARLAKKLLYLENGCPNQDNDMTLERQQRFEISRFLGNMDLHLNETLRVNFMVEDLINRLKDNEPLQLCHNAVADLNVTDPGYDMFKENVALNSSGKSVRSDTTGGNLPLSRTSSRIETKRNYNETDRQQQRQLPVRKEWNSSQYHDSSRARTEEFADMTPYEYEYQVVEASDIPSDQFVTLEPTDTAFPHSRSQVNTSGQRVKATETNVSRGPVAFEFKNMPKDYDEFSRFKPLSSSRASGQKATVDTQDTGKQTSPGDLLTVIQNWCNNLSLPPGVKDATGNDLKSLTASKLVFKIGKLHQDQDILNDRNLYQQAAGIEIDQALHSLPCTKDCDKYYEVRRNELLKGLDAIRLSSAERQDLKNYSRGVEEVLVKHLSPGRTTPEENQRLRVKVNNYNDKITGALLELSLSPRPDELQAELDSDVERLLGEFSQGRCAQLNESVKQDIVSDLKSIPPPSRQSLNTAVKMYRLRQRVCDWLTAAARPETGEGERRIAKIGSLLTSRLQEIDTDLPVEQFEVAVIEELSKWLKAAPATMPISGIAQFAQIVASVLHSSARPITADRDSQTLEPGKKCRLMGCDSNLDPGCTCTKNRR